MREAELSARHKQRRALTTRRDISHPVSMSRKGICWDNAVMESFFGSLKEVCVGSTVYPSHEHARGALFEYLEIYSNRQRHHSSLGYVSPLTYEQIVKQQAEENVDVLHVS